MPKTSPRVRIAIVMAASSERPNESSKADSSVALMNRPPVLHKIAAPNTSSNGEVLSDGRESVTGVNRTGAQTSGLLPERSLQAGRLRSSRLGAFLQVEISECSGASGLRRVR